MKYKLPGDAEPTFEETETDADGIAYFNPPLGAFIDIRVLRQDFCWNHRIQEIASLDEPTEVFFIECATIGVNAAEEIWANFIPEDESLEPYRQLMQRGLTYYCLLRPGKVTI